VPVNAKYIGARKEIQLVWGARKVLYERTKVVLGGAQQSGRTPSWLLLLLAV